MKGARAAALCVLFRRGAAAASGCQACHCAGNYLPASRKRQLTGRSIRTSNGVAMKKSVLKATAQSGSNLLKAMEVFAAVAETGQMTAAARMLGMTQSAASQQIAALEKSYGVTLFDRSVRPARLTQAGTLLHRHAARILNVFGDLETEMRHQGPTPISVLRLGILASIATTLTPGLVALAKKGFGVRDVTLHAGQSGDHENLLRTKKADLAITSNPFYDMDGLERHPILQEAFLLVLPEKYRGPTDSLNAVQSRLPLIRFADSTSVGRQITQHLRRLRLKPQQVIQADRSSHGDGLRVQRHGLHAAHA